jgi:hypothetical protein
VTLSLILPFWNRAQATDVALKRMGELYAEFDMEVVIVDDGSEPAYYVPPGLPFRARVIHLPTKREPLNPCLPINIGVASTSGEHIAISNPEILHRFAVLPRMVQALATADYIAAACWCPDTRRWHAHSSRDPLYADNTSIRMPAGAQYHFLAVLARSSWQACGGFDPEYRDGAGYDDNDFLMRLDRAGARFVVRDDLVVDHSRNGARAEWTREMYARNRAIFESKWAA